MKKENGFQADLIKELKQLFPGCVVLKNDPNYQQGFPDLLILFRRHWAALEVKRSENEPYQPNQPYWLEVTNELSFSATIYPENKEEVLDELQSAFGTRRQTRVPVR